MLNAFFNNHEALSAYESNAEKLQLDTYVSQTEVIQLVFERYEEFFWVPYVKPVVKGAWSAKHRDI